MFAFVLISIIFLFLTQCQAQTESFVYGQCDWEKTGDFSILVFCNLGYLTIPQGTATPTSISWAFDTDPLNAGACDDQSNINVECVNAGSEDQYFYYLLDECITAVANENNEDSMTFIRYVVGFDFDNDAGPHDVTFGFPDRNSASVGGTSVAQLTFTVDLNNGNSGNAVTGVGSDVGLFPVYFELGVANTIAIMPTDIDGTDIVTCRKSIESESQISDNSFYSIDENTCELTMNVNGNEGDMYAVQIMMVSETSNGDFHNNPIDFTLIGTNDGSLVGSHTCDALCSARAASLCSNDPCACDEDSLNCHICHENQGCSQCEPDHWKIDYNYKCIECTDEYVGQGCMFCQDFNGCGQCSQGYNRVYNTDCEYYVCE